MNSKQYFDGEYQGQWAVILGASSGFGAAAARRFAESGLNIFGIHMDRKSGMAAVDDLQAEIKKTGREAIFINMNAADATKRAEAIATMREKAPGKVRILMHSLAFGALKPIIGAPGSESTETLTQAQVEMTLDVMASSLVYWSQDLVRASLFAKHASIYAMTSAGSSRVWKSYGAVSAAKAALESYIRQLALETAPLGISANAILAGVTDTPALRKIPGNEEMIKTATARNPMGRLTTPDDVARALVAFSLTNCQFMTGNTIRIDGGENVVD